MSYRLFRHPDVEKDLFSIAKLIAEFAGLEIAERKLSEIEATLQLLRDTPHIGTLRNGIYPGLRAIPTARKGVVTFFVDDSQKAVYVVSITYAGSDWLKRLAERTR